MLWGEGERKDLVKAQMFLVLVVPLTDMEQGRFVGEDAAWNILNLRLKEAVGYPLNSCPCDSTAKSQGLYEVKNSGKGRNGQYAITFSNEESPGDIGESSLRKKVGTGATW